MIRLTIRPARAEEIPALESLITASARKLSQGYYTDAEIEAAIAHVFGVDSELVDDGTYLVVEADDGVLGCGGWSKRATRPRSGPSSWRHRRRGAAWARRC